MKLKGPVTHLLSLAFAAVLWLPLSAWLMPRILDAPQWHDNPSWYLSSLVVGIGLSCALQWMWDRRQIRPIPAAQRK